MSDGDSFIREVTEEVRQERMLKLWKRFAPYIIGGLVLIVVASAGWSWMQSREAAAARETGGRFLSAELSDIADAEDLVAATDGAAAPIARLRLAVAQAASGERERAVETFRNVAGTPGLARAYADLAALKAARLEAETGDPDAVIGRLDRLIGPSGPYRLLARELRATLHLNAGRTGEARADLAAIMDDPAATAALRARAGQLLEAIGGAPEGAGG